jgi:hypothetical protein
MFDRLAQAVVGHPVLVIAGRLLVIVAVIGGAAATLTLNSEIAQVGFAVAAGILLSTFVAEVLEPMKVLRISDNEWR